MADRLEIITKFTPEQTGPIIVEMSPYFLTIDDAMHFSYISRCNEADHLKNSTSLLIQPGQVNTLIVRYDSGEIQIQLNGKESLQFKSKYRPSIDRIAVTWPGKTAIHRFDVSASFVSGFIKYERSDTYAYHITVDFDDDMIPAPYTRPMLSDLMRQFVDAGIKRVYWIYNGNRHEGFWDKTGDYFLPDANVSRTFKNLGDDDLKAAVEMGHRYGLEVYAIVKPFDLSWNVNFAPKSPQALKYGKFDVLGGKGYLGDHFIAEHPELCLQARTKVQRSKATIEKIVLTSVQPSAHDLKKIILWVSDDNQRYRPYELPYQVERTAKQIVLSGLNIQSPFFAVEVPDDVDRNRFVNVLSDLIKVYNSQEELVDFTYGLVPRTLRKHEKNKEHLAGMKLVGGRFEKDGFFFDHWPGVPSSFFCGDKTLLDGLALDNSKGVLGLAVGHNSFVPGVMCPSEPRARTFWLDRIEQALACGVDGVDIRRLPHSNVLRWRDYGFNTPIVKAFKEKYDLDVRTEEFLMEKWRRLRGDYFTAFMHQVRELVHHHGKKLQLHVENMMQGTPDVSTVQEIFWDWKRWIREGLADEVTFKMGAVNDYRTHMGVELISLCRQKGIPIYCCPFIHRVAGVLHRKDWKMYLDNEVRNSGANGFIIYESAHLFVSQRNGSIRNIEPELTQYISK
jgi:hypothetical protein